MLGPSLLWTLGAQSPTMYTEIKSITLITQVVVYESFVREVLSSPCASATVDLVRLLDPVPNAAYDRAGYVARCHDGTRQKLIKEILRWISNDKGRPILWLNGPAGSGKSTASQTIAERMADLERFGNEGFLAASFYFLRGRGQRSQISHFIPTLAHQLSISVPSAKPHIQKVLQDDPQITQRALSHQFQKLMIEPVTRKRDILSRALNLQKPAVIIVDALDECDDKDMMAEFIEAISNLCQRGRRFPFRLLVTSRVEEHIRRKLENPTVQATVRHLSLLDFDASDDIRTFLRSRFSAIHDENRLMRHVPKPWPSNSDLQLLVGKASGSFIFASTLVNFINHNVDHPDEKLRLALNAHAGLDPLYHQVLSSVRQDAKSKLVIGTIMLLKSPSSINGIAELLQLDPTAVLQVLLPMQSIILIPGDDDLPVQLFHTSLRDFLLAPERSGESVVDQGTCHSAISRGSWRLLSNQFPNTFFEKGSIKEYCCCHWGSHFNELLPEQMTDLLSDHSVIHHLMSYLSLSFDQWINTLIFNRSLDENLASLRLMQTELQVSWAVSMFEIIL